MVLFVNELRVIGELADFERVTAEISAYMCQQPGYVSHKMLLSTKRENVFLEIAEWESAEHHAAAIASEGFRSRVQGLFGVIEKPTPDIYTVVHDSAADVAHAA